MKNLTSRKIYFEIMRIIACYFVVFNHSMIISKNNRLSNFGEWIQLFLLIFSKFSVPLFFMISGALLLNKEEDIKTIFLKRISKMTLTLIVFSFLYYLFGVLDKNVAFSFTDFIIKIYSDYVSINITFWFLYAYIGFLIILPFLRTIAQNLSNDRFIYLFGLVIIVNTIIPLFEYFYSRGTYGYNTNLLVGYGYVSWLGKECILYPLAGYFLDNRVDVEKSKRTIAIMWIINIITILLSCFFTHYKINCLGIDGDDLQLFRSTFVYINAFTLFLSIKYICITWEKRVHIFDKIICTISQCTFGIYLVHMLVISILEQYVGHDTLVNSFIFTCLVFAICYGVTFILRKIPIIQKIV